MDNMAGNLDLKVLRAIHVLCEAGSVTKAANILNVTPGAISYLINKARKETGSILFIRTQTGMAPDTIARELSARYLSISQELSRSEEGPANHRPMVVSAYTLVELLLSLAVLNEESEYPELIFNRQKSNDHQRLIKLRNREVDLDIGTRLPVDSSITQLRFYAGNAGVLVRKNHPTVTDKVTLEDWRANKHVAWLRGMHFINDDFSDTHKFNELANDRDIAFTSSSSLNLVTVCMLSDVMVLIPEVVGRKLATIMAVNWFKPPEEIDMRYECYLHYHRAMSGNESMKKLVALFDRVFDIESSS
jgi:DNA-binding transcriptional LysR family regulator